MIEKAVRFYVYVKRTAKTSRGNSQEIFFVYSESTPASFKSMFTAASLCSFCAATAV
jgi:hypothetical protein